MKQAIAYTRVSTKGQTGTDKHGADAQVTGIKKYLDEKYPDGYELVLFTEQISGTKEHKPELENAFDYAQQHNIKEIHVYGDDRFSRNLLVKLATKKRMTQMGIKMVDVLMPLEDSIEGEFLSNIMGSVSQLEIGKIVRRMYGGRLEKAATKYAGGAVPFGYKAVKTVVDGKVVKSIEKADNYIIVEELAKYESMGLNYSQMAATLNSVGYKTTRGGQFTAETVKRILNAPARRGVVVYAGIEATI